MCKKVGREAGLDPLEIWKFVKAKSLELIRALNYRGFDWQYVFQLVASELGVREVPDVLKTLEVHLSTFSTNEGAYEMLEKIKKRGHRIEIATNGLSTYQLPVIKALGLDRYIDGVRTSDMYKCPKSCPQFFQEADLIIGDNPVFDTYFPKKFGLFSIFFGDWEREVARQRQRLGIDASETRPDASILSLIEAPAAVEKVLKRFNL
jgi:putative hydrolase of the HAD superfamily